LPHPYIERFFCFYAYTMLRHKEEVPVLCSIFKTTPITPCIWISCPRSFLLQIVKHHSQEVGLQRRVFVDFFCNPERLRSQVRELTARVRALQVAWSTCSFSLSVYSILTSKKKKDKLNCFLNLELRPYCNPYCNRKSIMSPMAASVATEAPH
jgi:hypothetical protein